MHEELPTLSTLPLHGSCRFVNKATADSATSGTMVRKETNRIFTPDQTLLCADYYDPEATDSAARVPIIIVHGYCEHRGRYRILAEHLVEVRDRFGWSHAKIGGYESPPEDEITAWRLREEFAADTVTDHWVAAHPLALDASKRGS